MTKANGIDICSETFGDTSHPTVLFVIGLGAPLLAWPQMFVSCLVDAGFPVLRYDNRDAGCSDQFDSDVSPGVGGGLTRATKGL